jgi:FkbH-like protein
MHAFYQRLLSAFSSEGVLIAVASKNELSLVEKAFGRKDLALSANSVFPMEVSWGPKSEAVARIITSWNVGGDSVVFIDDSPLELAEVKASHPDVECIKFPTKDSLGVYNLAFRLRDVFGKNEILQEDMIRKESIKRSHAGITPQDSAKTTPANFLEQVEAEMSFNFSKSPLDPRALELVNKTNQFNLNAKRYTQASWHNYLLDPASFLMVISYTDKYGPLGKIAVVAGRQEGKRLKIATWVMSCRAFSRRIECRSLEELFAKFAVEEIELDFLATERNSPLREFLTELLSEVPTPGCEISRHAFEARAKTLHEPKEMING